MNNDKLEQIRDSLINIVEDATALMNRNHDHDKDVMANIRYCQRALEVVEKEIYCNKVKPTFPEPWISHPHLWKTKAAFFTYLRGGIRRGVWERSPAKIDFKNKSMELPPSSYTGRGKSGKTCALSGQWIHKSALEVDHIIGNVSLKGWDDLVPFVQHMSRVEGNLQLVGKEPHKIKSHAEKKGITYEEAVIDKRIIAIMKKSVIEINRQIKRLGGDVNDTKNKDTRKAFFFRMIKGGLL